MSFLTFLKFSLTACTFLAIVTLTDRFVTSNYINTTVDYLKVVKARTKGGSSTQHVNLILNNNTTFPVSVHDAWHYDSGDSVIIQQSPWFNNPIAITNLNKKLADKPVSGPHIYFSIVPILVIITSVITILFGNKTNVLATCAAFSVVISIYLLVMIITNS